VLRFVEAEEGLATANTGACSTFAGCAKLNWGWNNRPIPPMNAIRLIAKATKNFVDGEMPLWM
jgi:hypothetical protein